MRSFSALAASSRSFFAFASASARFCASISAARASRIGFSFLRMMETYASSSVDEGDFAGIFISAR